MKKIKKSLDRNALTMKIATHLALGVLVLSVGALCLSPLDSEVNADGTSEMYRSAGEKGAGVSLMFNVYWGTESVYRILDILKEHDAKATFFIGGSWADDNVDCLREIYAKGHEIGNHSENHKQMSTLSKEQCKAEIKQVHNRVKELTGLDMTVFRPPFGDYNDTVIEAANELGYHVIQWDVDSLDWKDYGCDSILHTVTCHKHLGNGSIILMHNGAKYTKDALEQMIIELKSQGYEFVTVSELIYKENYQMDHEGRQYVEGLNCPPQAEVSPTPRGILREY